MKLTTKANGEKIENSTQNTTRTYKPLTSFTVSKIPNKFYNFRRAKIKNFFCMYLLATVGRFAGGSNRDSGSQTEGAKTVTS